MPRPKLTAREKKQLAKAKDQRQFALLICRTLSPHTIPKTGLFVYPRPDQLAKIKLLPTEMQTEMAKLRKLAISGKNKEEWESQAEYVRSHAEMVDEMLTCIIDRYGPYGSTSYNWEASHPK